MRWLSLARPTCGEPALPERAGRVELDCDEPDRLRTVRSYADMLEELTSEALKGFNLTRVGTRAAELRAALDQPDSKRRLGDGTIRQIRKAAQLQLAAPVYD